MTLINVYNGKFVQNLLDVLEIQFNTTYTSCKGGQKLSRYEKKKKKKKKNLGIYSLLMASGDNMKELLVALVYRHEVILLNLVTC